MLLDCQILFCTSKWSKLIFPSWVCILKMSCLSLGSGRWTKFWCGVWILLLFFFWQAKIKLLSAHQSTPVVHKGVKKRNRWRDRQKITVTHQKEPNKSTKSRIGIEVGLKVQFLPLLTLAINILIIRNSKLRWSGLKGQLPWPWQSI